MIRSSFFNSIGGDRKYDASKFAEYFNSFIGNGVFPMPLDGLQVISNDDMTVTVKEGKAWINGYIMINDDDYILPIDVADGVLKRIDRVVVRLDTTDREIRVEVKKGTFASVPVAPSLQRDADAYELGIADILISNGVISIIQANITDLRSDTEFCGKVDSLIAGDINSLIADLEAHKDNMTQHIPTITGIYTGDGESSRTIVLGFRPKAVLMLNNRGSYYNANVVKGGLAIDGSPVQKMPSQPVITIVATGFLVYETAYEKSNTLSSVYNYLAVK